MPLWHKIFVVQCNLLPVKIMAGPVFLVSLAKVLHHQWKQHTLWWHQTHRAISERGVCSSKKYFEKDGSTWNKFRKKIDCDRHWMWIWMEIGQLSIQGVWNNWHWNRTSYFFLEGEISRQGKFTKSAKMSSFNKALTFSKTSP